MEQKLLEKDIEGCIFEVVIPINPSHKIGQLIVDSIHYSNRVRFNFDETELATVIKGLIWSESLEEFLSIVYPRGIFKDSALAELLKESRFIY